MNKTSLANRRFAIASLAVLLLVFVLEGALVGGDILMGDSNGYITASLRRDGLYPGFLALLRGIFGEGLYLTAAVYIQDAFLALSVWALCLYLKRAFALEDWAAWACVAVCILGLCLLSLASVKHVLVTHLILTEGLAVPIVLFSARLLLAAVLEKRFGPFWLALMVIFPSLMLRSQMWFLLILWLIVGLYVAISTRARFVRYALIAVVCAVVAAGGLVGGKLLHLMLSGRYVGTQFGKATIATKLLYLSDEEDAALLAGDPEAQELFSAVYAKAIRDEDNYRFAEPGFLGSMRHFSGCYNDLHYDNVKPQLARMFGDELEADVLIRMTETCGRLIGPLLRAHAGDYIVLSMNSMLLGLVRSNSALLLNNERLPAFFDSPLLLYFGLIWSALLYLAVIVLTVLAFRRDRDSRAGRMTLFSMVLLLGNLAPNALAYNVIARYAILGALPFYLSLMMLVWELFFQARSALPAAETSA